MTDSDIYYPRSNENAYPRTVPMQVTGYAPARVPSDMMHISERQTNMIGEDVRRWSGLAVLSIVCAALAVPFWWLLVPAPLAVLFGFLAKVNTDDGSKRGYTLAKIGRIAGFVEIGIACVVFILMGVIAITSWYSSPYTTK